jgi:hypothetical protein
LGYITEETAPDVPAKILLIGKSGAGKTGSLAALVAAGYKLRILNTDKNTNILHSLLFDYRYPYRKFCEAKGIDLATAVHTIDVDQPMKLASVHRKIGDRETSERMLGPVDGTSWYKCIDALEKWPPFGHVETWDNSIVLVVDAFSKLARMAYYNIQSLNGRLGARDEGREYQRDVGGAQAILVRLLEWLACSKIRCNVLLISHITWVDESRGFSQSPQQMQMQDQVSDPDGLPMAIGRALSPMVGSFFGDVFVMRQSGSGQITQREISTVSVGGVLCKNSAFMNSKYSIGSGLAEIFAALRHQLEPTELIAACGRPARQSAPAQTSARSPTPPVDDEIARLNAAAAK